MRSGTRAATVAGIVALALAGVAACGSGNGSRTAGGSPGAAHAVQLAYAATTNAKTATFRLDEKIQAQGPGGPAQSATITGTGQADFATKAVTVTLSTPGVGNIRFLLLNGTEYVQLPATARSQIPGGKPWVSVDLNKISQARLGASFSQIASASDDNPAQALSELSAVSSGVSKGGSATVAGVPTTEYRAQVNLYKVAARTQAKAGAAAGQAVRREIKALGKSRLPIDVWVDAHHLVRRMSLQVQFTAPGGEGAGGTAKAVLTTTFTGFGMPVRLSPPPASQTTNITSEILQHAGSGRTQL